MTEAEKIFNMIENVDPTDSATLDEIDFRVDKYLGGVPNYIKARQYTRSRDALKAVRPEGWWFHGMSRYFDEPHIYVAEPKDDDSLILSPSLPTEELAELHAIVQAIAYEREKV